MTQGSKWYAWSGEAEIVVLASDPGEAAMALVNRAAERGQRLGESVKVNQSGPCDPAEAIYPISQVRAWLGL